MNTPAAFRPAYLSLLDSGELERRVESAYRHLEDCDLCARYCRVNRRQTLEGAACRTGEKAVVHSYGAHHGEEAPLSGHPLLQLVQSVLCLLPELGNLPARHGA